MKTKLLLLLLLPLLIGASCKKDKDDGLTKPTQTGANTFSCKINGENFIASQSLFGPNATFVEDDISESNPSFRVEGRSTNASPYITVEIKIFNKINVGTYSLGGNSINYGKIEYRTPSNNFDIYQTNIGLAGEVTFFKVDRVNHIYSGTFTFNSSNGSKENTVTQGHFDVRYN